MKHLTIKVEGIVQGVGFRWAARNKANQLGVTGFARNEDDLFRAWCEQGPVSARVDRVTVESGKVKGYSGFEIR